jgi:hypothetical protein
LVERPSKSMLYFTGRVIEIYLLLLKSDAIEVLHDHVTAAMLNGRSNKIVLHEIEFNSSGERYSIVLPSNT